jgi:hypothetical protein
MTAEDITRWLAAPTRTGSAEALEKAMAEWPWFTPLRLMKAVDAGERSFPERLHTTLSLYADNWLPAYQLLMQEESGMLEEADELSHAVPDEPMPRETELESQALPDDEQPEPPASQPAGTAEDDFIQPAFTEDYFRYEGLEASDELPRPAPDETAAPQTLMVVMSFSEWLNHFKKKAQKEEEEAREKSALRSMWQQEKLASAIEAETEEIPDDVFEMAVSSITKEDDLASESLAQIYERQEKWAAAAEMYRKLALKYPSKSAYFAGRADAAKKQLK